MNLKCSGLYDTCYSKNMLWVWLYSTPTNVFLLNTNSNPTKSILETMQSYCCLSTYRSTVLRPPSYYKMLSIHVQGKILPHYKELILMEISIGWKAYSKPCLDYTVCFAYNRTNCFSCSVIFIKVPLKRHEVFSFRWHWFKDRCPNQSYLFTETPCTIIWNSPMYLWNSVMYTFEDCKTNTV